MNARAAYHEHPVNHYYLSNFTFSYLIDTSQRNNYISMNLTGKYVHKRIPELTIIVFVIQIRLLASINAFSQNNYVAKFILGVLNDVVIIRLKKYSMSRLPYSFPNTLQHV